MTEEIKTLDLEEESLNLDQLKKKLEMRIPKEAELRIDEFMKVEAALTLALEVGGPNMDANKVNVLLSNYSLVRPETFGPEEHLMQLARRNIFHLSSGRTWRKSLRCYLKSQFNETRFFDVEKGLITVRENPFGEIDRRPLYMEMLTMPTRKVEAPAVAKPGHSYRYCCRSEEGENNDSRSGQDRQITIPEGIPVCRSAATHSTQK